MSGTISRPWILSNFQDHPSPPHSNSNKLWNINSTVHVNERNQNKNITKSRHIQIDRVFCCSIQHTNNAMALLKKRLYCLKPESIGRFINNINVWLSMMSGHGPNSIFFNKKVKVGRPEHFLSPRPFTFDNIFSPYLPLKIDIICVSSLRSTL